jgi:hypothetical protein
LGQLATLVRLTRRRVESAVAGEYDQPGIWSLWNSLQRPAPQRHELRVLRRGEVTPEPHRRSRQPCRVLTHDALEPLITSFCLRRNGPLVMSGSLPRSRRTVVALARGRDSLGRTLWACRSPGRSGCGRADRQEGAAARRSHLLCCLWDSPDAARTAARTWRVPCCHTRPLT